MTGRVPRVRHFAQNRLQNLRPLQGASAGGPDRSLAAPGAQCQPIAEFILESLIVSLQDTKSHTGAPARSANCSSGYRTAMSRFLPKAPSMRCSTVTAWSSAQAAHATARDGTPLSEGTAPNDLWCADFKGEFKLGNGRYCLDRHRSRLAPLSAVVRGTQFDPRTAGHYRSRTAVSRARPAIGHSLRQRRALCQSQCLVQSLKAFGMVAPARHRHRPHQARSSAAERPP